MLSSARMLSRGSKTLTESFQQRLLKVIHAMMFKIVRCGLKKILNEYLFKNIDIISFKNNIRKYKNKYKNKDCIITGSGPSLPNIPKEFLKKYFIIGVNGSYNYILPNIHVMIDPKAFWVPELREKLVKNNIPFFVTWAWTPKRAIFPKKNEIFVPWKRINTHLDEDKNPELSNYMYQLYNNEKLIEVNGFSSSMNVVPEAAIPLAYYMGFKNVYLAGLDWGTKVDGESHFYPDDPTKEKSSKLRMNLKKKWGLSHWNELWISRKWIMENIMKTNKKNRIFNLTLDSNIEKIPKISYKDLP